MQLVMSSSRCDQTITAKRWDRSSLSWIQKFKGVYGPSEHKMYPSREFRGTFFVTTGCWQWHELGCVEKETTRHKLRYQLSSWVCIASTTGQVKWGLPLIWECFNSGKSVESNMKVANVTERALSGSRGQHIRLQWSFRAVRKPPGAGRGEIFWHVSQLCGVYTLLVHAIQAYCDIIWHSWNDYARRAGSARSVGSCRG